MRLVGYYLCVVFLVCCVHCEEASPRVKVKQGEIKGKIMNTFKNRKIYSFLGIPYAKPPIAERRFKLPEPIEAWNTVLNAKEDGPVCPQKDFITRQTVGQEDCLVLNVYTPQLPTATDSPKLPVMVFIYGGGFLFGEGSSTFYGPKRLLDKDIVLVAMNYRVGALGFLSTGDDVVPGNLGLWDQNLALKWVQENIPAFGGDPDSVTLFGESAGAASIQYHLISRASEGLFHKAILQSGSVLCPWGNQPSLSYGFKLGKLLDCPVTSSQVLVDCLQKKSAEEIVEKTSIMDKWPFQKLHFIPVPEKNTKGPRFLEDDPRALLEKGKFHRYPIITGITKDEGLMYIFEGHANQEKFEKSFIENVMDLYLTNYISSKALPSIKEVYFKDLNLEKFDKKKFRKDFIEVVSDMNFKSPNEDTIMYFSKHVPTYMYILEEPAQYNFARIFGFEENLGTSHGDDLPYLFDGSLAPGKLEGRDKEISEAMIQFWTDFAKFGDPNGRNKDKLWEPSTPQQIKYFSFGNTMKTENYEISKKTEEWKKIERKYRCPSSARDEL